LIRRTASGFRPWARLFEPLSRMSIEDKRAIPGFGNAPWQPRSIRNVPQSFGTQPHTLFFQPAHPRLTSSKLFVPRTFKGNKFSTDARPRLPWHPFFSLALRLQSQIPCAPPLTKRAQTQGPSTRSPLIHRRPASTIFLLAFALSLTTACASGPGGSLHNSSYSADKPSRSLPNSGTVLLGNTLAFLPPPPITNTSDTSVFWSVNGISGGLPSSSAPSSADGIFYRPPQTFPRAAKVQVTRHQSRPIPPSPLSSASPSPATSPSRFPPVSSSVELGALQSFHASIASSGKPDPAIRWSPRRPRLPKQLRRHRRPTELQITTAPRPFSSPSAPQRHP